MPALERRDRWTAVALCVLCGFLYLESPVRQFGDSFYSLLLSESLLTHGSFRLDPFFEPPLEPHRYPGTGGGDELPYQIAAHGDHLYYGFPPGSSLLSIPAVAIGRLAGYSTIAVDGTYDVEAEKKLQKRLAALLSAVTVAILFTAARRRLSWRASLLTATAAALATPIWSSASRALWSHTWLLVLMALVVAELLRRDPGAQPLRAVPLGTLLGLAYWVRPTAAVPILMVTLWVAMRQRRRLPALLATMALWFGLLVAWSLSYFGTPLPPYFSATRLDGSHLGVALAGNLISPARGVLVYCPVLFFVGWLLVRYRRQIRRPDLAALGCGVVTLHWLTISAYSHWWGGYSYGPRLMTDLVPWLTLLAVLGLQARDRTIAASGRRRRIESSLGAVLLLASFGMHAVGGLLKASGDWNVYPVDVDRRPQRLWDWSDPQFLPWGSHRHYGDRRAPTTSTAR